jgi:hypothetical protein
LNTLGDYIRARRIDLDQFQSAVAEQIGASVITLKPAIRYQFKTGQRDWPET